MITGRGRVALRLAVGVALMAGVLWYADGAQVLARLRGIDLRFFALACALLALGQVLNAMRWRWLLKVVVADPPPSRALFALVVIGMFFSFILPSTVGGDVVRAEMVKAHVGGRANAYSSIVVSRIVGLLGVLALGAIAVTLAYGALGWYDAELMLAWVLVVLPLLGFTLWMFKGMALGPWVRRMPEPVGAALARARGALAAYAAQPRVLWRVFVVAVIANALGTVGVVWALAGGLASPAPGYFHFIAVPLAMLITMVPVSINGIGLREGAFAYLYAKVGVGAAAAVSLSLSFTAVLALFSLIGGSILLWPRKSWLGDSQALPSPPREEGARTGRY